jgi:hypothetical protein
MSSTYYVEESCQLTKLTATKHSKNSTWSLSPDSIRRHLGCLFLINALQPTTQIKYLGGSNKPARKLAKTKRWTNNWRNSTPWTKMGQKSWQNLASHPELATVPQNSITRACWIWYQQWSEMQKNTESSSTVVVTDNLDFQFLSRRCHTLNIHLSLSLS